MFLTPGWSYDQRNDRTDQQNHGNDMQRLCLVSCGLANSRDQRGPQYSGKAPRREHKTVNRSYVLAAEVIGGISWHGAKAAAVTKQNQKSQRRKAGETCYVRDKEKDDDLHQKHE
jgi:hypothetical protein